MRDFFYTILIIWLAWRIYVSFSKRSSMSRKVKDEPYKKEGETTVDHIPENKKRGEFKGGEYVDYEDIK